MARINQWEKKVETGIKNTLSKMIKNISIMAIFMILIIVTIAALGAQFNLSGALQVGLGVASVLLLIGSLLLYELWLRNGQDNGREQEEFKEALKLFLTNSKNIHNETMQNFIEWEKARRYDVEKRKIEDEISRLEEKSKKKDLSEKARANLIIRIQNLKDFVIEVDMPYTLAEEFDQLKYSVLDIKAKEYKPNDARKALKKNRIQKYSISTVFTLFSVNIIVMVGITPSWQVLFIFLMALVTITISVVMGFSNGFTLIMRNTLGIYNTANDFIEKAKDWCHRKNISLYYKEETYEFSVYALDKNFDASNVDLPEDYYRPTLEESFGRQEVIIE